MHYPKIKFCLNKDLDKRMAIEFIGRNYHGGFNFAQGILGPHPGIKRSIFNYIDNFYRQRHNLLIKTASEFQKIWLENAESFFYTTDIIFHHHSWPKGKYRGYISIFSCGPRFLHDKTFQVFYKNDHKRAVFCTAHEILHFLFYDYIEKKRENIKNKLNDEQLWRISEIVNEVLLDPKYLGGVLGITVRQKGYPDFIPITNRIRREFKKKDDVNKLIDLAIKFGKK
mgnify:CR=1 FL=1